MLNVVYLNSSYIFTPLHLHIFHFKHTIKPVMSTISFFFTTITENQAGKYQTCWNCCTRTPTILDKLGAICPHCGCQTLFNKSQEPKEGNNKAKVVLAWLVDSESRLLVLMTNTDRFFVDLNHFTFS